MKKIPTIFQRNPENMSQISKKIHPDCKWVFSGEGVATQKYDGTCCRIENGTLFKRREIKKGKKIPEQFIIEQYDANTEKRFGWRPVSQKTNEDKWHRSAFTGDEPDGTYELCGPKIQKNLEKLETHKLIPHSKAKQFHDCPRDYDALKVWLQNKDIEGIVWHHSDGRMAKIKKRDFGLSR